MSSIGLPGPCIEDHFAPSGLCQCPCEECTLRLSRLCVCEDCCCESQADHRVDVEAETAAIERFLVAAPVTLRHALRRRV